MAEGTDLSKRMRALIELAAAGWLEPVAPEFRYFAATDAGKAAWARLAQQAA